MATIYTAAVFKPFAVESSPVVFNGRLIVLYVPRTPAKSDTLCIVDYFTGETIQEVSAMGLFLGCALVVGNTLHYWGITSDNKTIKHSTTTDLVNWTTPTTAWTAAAGQYIYNTSVCYDPVNGRYIMAYETSEPYNGYVDFNIRWFSATSPDGPWNPYGNIFGPDRYVACPTLKYSTQENFWYMFYLVHEGGVFKTRVARATDPSGTWAQSAYFAVTPYFPGDLNNASDLDFIEYQGNTYGMYSVGDQNRAMDLKQVIWTVPMNTFLSYFSQ